MFSWKRLRYWKIGFSTWEVIVVERFPKHVEDGELDEAWVDPQHRQIYIKKHCIISPWCFLEVIFHELTHAMDYEGAIDNQMLLKDTLKEQNQKDELHELNVELRAVCLLRLMSDNRGNFEYVLKIMGGKN